LLAHWQASFRDRATVAPGWALKAADDLERVIVDFNSGARTSLGIAVQE